MDFNILSRIQFQIKQIWCKIKSIEISQGIQSIIAGTNVTVDNTDPLNPIISATGGGGSVTDQDNIPTFVDVTLDQIGYVEGDTEDEKIEKLRVWILAQNFVIGEKEIWYFQLEKSDSESTALTLEQARQNGNVLEGDVEFINQGDYKKIYSLGDFGENRFNFNNEEAYVEMSSLSPDAIKQSHIRVGTSGLAATNITSTNEDESTSLAVFSDRIVIASSQESVGLVGSQEFNKQGDRKAFAQLSDLYDMISTPQVIITSDPSYEIEYNGSATRVLLTLQGTSTDVMLPSMAETLGLVIIIKNAGSGTSTIMTHTDDTEGIWEGGMTSESITLNSGSVATISNDGIQYTII